MSLLFKDHSLVEVINLQIRLRKTKFFQRNAKNTDGNGANKQDTHKHTKQSEKDNT